MSQPSPDAAPSGPPPVGDALRSADIAAVLKRERSRGWGRRIAIVALAVVAGCARWGGGAARCGARGEPPPTSPAAPRGPRVRRTPDRTSPPSLHSRSL